MAVFTVQLCSSAVHPKNKNIYKQYHKHHTAVNTNIIAINIEIIIAINIENLISCLVLLAQTIKQ